MSNRRRLRAPGTEPAEQCTFCSRAIRGRAALRLRNGQRACPKCQENGGLQKLACGHAAPAGALAVNLSGDGKTYLCRPCAAEAGW